MRSRPPKRQASVDPLQSPSAIDQSTHPPRIPTPPQCVTQAGDRAAGGRNSRGCIQGNEGAQAVGACAWARTQENSRRQGEETDRKRGMAERKQGQATEQQAQVLVKRVLEGADDGEDGQANGVLQHYAYRCVPISPHRSADRSTRPLKSFTLYQPIGPLRLRSASSRAPRPARSTPAGGSTRVRTYLRQDGIGDDAMMARRCPLQIGRWTLDLPLTHAHASYCLPCPQRWSSWKCSRPAPAPSSPRVRGKHLFTNTHTHVHVLGDNRPHLTFPFNRLEPTDPTELERVRQYASQQTRMHSHLLGNLVPLNADKVRLHARKHTELDGWKPPRLAHHPTTTHTTIGRAGTV